MVEVVEGRETYVSRESTGEKGMTSTLGRYRPRKTMLLFPRGGLCEQCSDLLKDPVETAMFGAALWSGFL